MKHDLCKDPRGKYGNIRRVRKLYSATEALGEGPWGGLGDGTMKDAIGKYIYASYRTENILTSYAAHTKQLGILILTFR